MCFAVGRAATVRAAAVVLAVVGAVGSIYYATVAVTGWWQPQCAGDRKE